MRGIVLGRRAGLALLGAVLLAPAAVVRAEPLVQISALEEPGRFEFIATGFEKNEIVSTWLTGPSGQVRSTPDRKVDQRGGILFRLRLPRFFEPGRWALTAHGLESDREAVGYFELAPRGPNLEMTVEPAAGPPGAQFTFKADGFRADEGISYWLTGPDGVVRPGGERQSNDRGRFELRYRVPADAAPGGWTLTAYGMSSDSLAEAVVTITG